jgi:hypothetical protein
MTLTEKDLRRLRKTASVPITAEQRRSILERFGTEPWPYDRSEQDIAVQIRNFLDCGEFVKTAQDAGNRSALLPDADF